MPKKPLRGIRTRLALDRASYLITWMHDAMESAPLQDSWNHYLGHGRRWLSKAQDKYWDSEFTVALVRASHQRRLRMFNKDDVQAVLAAVKSEQDSLNRVSTI